MFVADVIPNELARIVEFLNDQMKADIRAVELKWFEAEDGATTLVPRVIGETARTAAQKAAGHGSCEQLSTSEWLSRLLYPFHLSRDRASVSISFAYLRKRPGLVDDADCRAAYDRFVNAVGPLSTDNLNGYPAFKVQQLADPAVSSRFESAARYLLDLAMPA